MFEIGYKIEVMPGDSPLKDVFQPKITLKIGNFYEEFYRLDEFIRIFEQLIRGLQVEGIEEMVFAFWDMDKKLRDFLSIIEIIERNDGEDEYYLKNYPVIYDKEENIVNLNVKENLEKKMKKLVNMIYKNIIPLFAKDFSIKFDGKYSIVLFLYYDSIGIHKELELQVTHNLVEDFNIDFFHMLKTLIYLFQLKELPETLKKFIDFIESKTNN